MNAPEDIKPLTALRFYAAMWVVLFHYWPKLAGVGASSFVERGYLGVELFFVLSGFILCHVYLPQVEAGRFRYGGFLWARIARVYPLHLATLVGVGVMALAATAAGMGIDPAILSWRSLPANLTLTHAWGFAPEAGWNHPSWSISAEWFAYLCFPLFAWAAMLFRSRPWAAVASALALLSGLYLIFPIFAGIPLTRATIAWGALRIVPCFALGCAAYLAWRSRPIKQASTAVMISGGLASLILLGAFWGAPDLLMTTLFGALIVSAASLTSTGSRLGTSRLGVWLGEISYAIYMVCIPWELLYVNGVQKAFGLEGDALPAGLWAVFFVSVIGVAALAHHLIERPARNLLRKWAVRTKASQEKFA